MSIQSRSDVEAMKQALEALEDLYAEQNAAPLWKRREHWENAMIKADVAIPNLRTAIEQAEFEAAHEALEKQAGIHVSQQSAEKQERNFCERCGKRLGDGRIHTCTPPAAQRPVAKPHKWVGLTDEELELLNDCGDTDSYKFARAIEAKLREKNIGESK